VVAYAPSKRFTEIQVKISTTAGEKTMPTDVGQQAPDFSLYDADKNLRSLSEFRGRNVVLAFFPSAFTGTCTDEMCNFQDRLEAFYSITAQVIGVSVDPPFSQKEWTTQNRITHPFLSDFNRQVVKDYEVTFENLVGLQGIVLPTAESL
jgi:peroxiredoxin